MIIKLIVKFIKNFNKLLNNLKINILNEYNKPANSRDNLFNYFIEKRLKNLVEHIGEF